MPTTPSKFRDLASVRTIAVIGAGAIGSGWATYFLAKGFDVVVADPSPDAEARSRAYVAHAWPDMLAIGYTEAGSVPEARLRYVRSPAEAAGTADFIQENAPENRELKHTLLAEIDAAAPPDVIIASSTSGILPSELQRACRHPGRLVVGHPFNPPSHIPLVEVVGGQQTDPAAVAWSVDFYRYIGKYPIVLRREMVAHLANRLQAALIREAIYCLDEGVASADDIDAAVRMGPGLRWAFMGWQMIFRLAGSEGGTAYALDHMAKEIDGWFDSLGDVRLTPEVQKKLVDAGEEIARGRPAGEWIEFRDRKVTALLRLLHEEPRYPGD
jgi:carnitine 3-dehydrogenase